MIASTNSAAKPRRLGNISEMPTGQLPAMELVGSSNQARILARLLLVMILLFSVAMIFTPWQQSVSGLGEVSALAPPERTQTISAPIDGRVLRWHVTEGSKVKKGTLIVELADNDPQIIERIRGERSAIEERRRNVNARIGAIQDRVARLEDSRLNAVSAARSRVQMALDRIRQAEQALTAAQERLNVANLNVNRQRNLLKSGLASQRNVELAQQDSVTAEAELRRSEAALSAARNEKLALDDDLRKVEADASASIQGERANIDLARAEVSSIDAELQRIDVRLSRQATQSIIAPRDGTVLRLLAQPDSEMLKAGSPVAIFVPDAATPTVELWVDGNDMPLIHPGDPVRLQFNGWPAIQFVGWPSVAVGTFGGRVQLVDASDTQGGKFRLLVIPDPQDDPWPSRNYLRQGVQAKGWVLLKMVPLGWELWRRFNGFPPSIAMDEPGASGRAKGGSK